MSDLPNRTTQISEAELEEMINSDDKLEMTLGMVLSLTQDTAKFSLTVSEMGELLMKRIKRIEGRLDRIEGQLQRLERRLG